MRENGPKKKKKKNQKCIITQGLPTRKTQKRNFSTWVIMRGLPVYKKYIEKNLFEDENGMV